MSVEIRLEALKSLTTRKLLSMLDKCRTDDKEVENMHIARAEAGLPWMYEWSKEYLQAQKISSYHEFTAAEIKAVLATREHVPNKLEARELCRARAKAGRQKGRKDR